LVTVWNVRTWEEKREKRERVTAAHPDALCRVFFCLSPLHILRGGCGVSRGPSHAGLRPAGHRPRRQRQGDFVAISVADAQFLVLASLPGPHCIHTPASSPLHTHTHNTQSTYCETIRDHCATIGRSMHVVNLGERPGAKEAPRAPGTRTHKKPTPPPFPHQRLSSFSSTPDPAAEDCLYPVAFDVRDLITVEDAMEELGLGPNG
jgi:hypothetical protein